MFSFSKKGIISQLKFVLLLGFLEKEHKIFSFFVRERDSYQLSVQASNPVVSVSKHTAV
jgi:hypothetical protein